MINKNQYIRLQETRVTMQLSTNTIQMMDISILYSELFQKKMQLNFSNKINIYKKLIITNFLLVINNSMMIKAK